jgi:hypothetical protein
MSLNETELNRAVQKDLFWTDVDIDKWISQEGHDKNVYFTVMVDLYSFPKQGNTIYDEEVINTRDAKEKIKKLEEKMLKRTKNFHRFIPYIQLHEFESLLFSDPEKLKNYFLDKNIQVDQLIKETANYKPEDINETPEGAPSKRLNKYLNYEKQKVVAGTYIANLIEIKKIKEMCPNFNAWLTKLEGISNK